jgi:hypothetical protein
MPVNTENRSSGNALKVWGIILIGLGALLYYLLDGSDDNPSALIAIPLMIGGLLLHFRGRQHAARARAADRAGPLYDSKPDVLYLRSFETDPSSTMKRLMAGLTTEEEQLADVLRPFGDLIAIGRPGEALPMPGANRMYATDSEWQGVVLDRMRSAPLVVIRAGTGPGLLWELGQAFSTVKPGRLLILIFNISKKEYAAFVSQMRESFGLELPMVGPAGLVRAVVDYRGNLSKVLPGFMMFEDDWTPKFVPLPQSVVRTGYNDFKKTFNLALRPVFERHGVAWHPSSRFGA